MDCFKAKHILITGASSGIGEALALAFAHEGANLLLTARSLDKLQVVAEQCRKQGALEVDVQQLDMANQQQIITFAQECNDNRKPFDYIVLNAGISQRAKTLETAFEVDEQIMQTNYFGPVLLVKHLDSLKTHRTHLAVTSSISGLFGFPLRSAYCASKHALFGFFESLELENEHLSVTFLIPGRVNTPISKSAMLANGERYNQMDAGQANGIPVEKCAKQALKAIAKHKHRKLIGGSELLMVYIKKWCPPLFFKLARKVSAT
ncbi:MAG: SDR family NAD(P)-dependent oxidoreductase [Bacteroidales bacterium]|nr:SDR family NAD(P)-dependent oxidoreductase [Bacteroidales bacterium]